MAFEDKIVTSVHGRRLGLQRVTTALSGGTLGEHEFLVGSYDGQRLLATTADTTLVALAPFGSHVLGISSVGSSQVYFIDPPIPGTGPVYIRGSTIDAIVLRTASTAAGNSPAVATSAGSSFAAVHLSSLGYGLTLIPLTTALWLSQSASTAAAFTWTETT